MFCMNQENNINTIAQYSAQEFAAIIANSTLKVAQLMTKNEELESKNAQLNLQVTVLRKKLGDQNGRSNLKHK